MPVETWSFGQLAPGPLTEPPTMLEGIDRIGFAQQAVLIFGRVFRRKQRREMPLVSVEFAAPQSDRIEQPKNFAVIR